MERSAMLGTEFRHSGSAVTYAKKDMRRFGISMKIHAILAGIRGPQPFVWKRPYGELTKKRRVTKEKNPMTRSA